MKIAVGIPAFNDEIFVEQSIQNCIDVGYDYVVYLDDGSTDKTYEKLMDYTKNYDHIKVIRNKENSVLTNSGNRWEKAATECSKVKPDWIMSRAVDEVLSYPAFLNGENLFRKNLEILDASGVNMLVFPHIHLWRSEWWHRIDGYWGGCYDNGVISAWKNNIGWGFNSKSGIHLGSHRPTNVRVKAVINEINNKTQTTAYGGKPVVVLHYGMFSHKCLMEKLDYQISTSMQINNRAVGMPSRIPNPKNWHHFNGYKIADEQTCILEKVLQVWYKDAVPNEPRPEIKSLYSVVAKYDQAIADRYATIYGR